MWELLPASAWWLGEYAGLETQWTVHQLPRTKSAARIGAAAREVFVLGLIGATVKVCMHCSLFVHYRLLKWMSVTGCWRS
jgi:hypothetical protein